MQSLFHEEWSRAFGATQGSADALTYNPTDVFTSLPFPEEEGFKSSLSEVFSEKRSALLKEMNQGPTVAYGRLNQPSENDDKIARFRRLHATANAEVAEAYGWQDICTSCGFGLEHLDIDDDTQIPESQINSLMNSELFFWNADEACAFQDQMQSLTGSRGKLPWRYRWPDPVRDDVLARLLALNAERYDEEVALGLHSKVAKPAAGAKRGRKPKAVAAATTLPAFQLEPEPLQIGLDLSGGR